MKCRFKCLSKSCGYGWDTPYIPGPGNKCPKCENTRLWWKNAAEVLTSVTGKEYGPFNKPEEI